MGVSAHRPHDLKSSTGPPRFINRPRYTLQPLSTRPKVYNRENQHHTQSFNRPNLYRWLDNPDFMAAYRYARRKAFAQATGRLQQVANKAVDTLESIMDDKLAPAHAKTSAATAVLRYGREGIELEDLSDRVEKLEQVLANAQ